MTPGPDEPLDERIEERIEELREDSPVERQLLTKAIGGWRGLFDSGVPAAVFVLVYLLNGNALSPAKVVSVTVIDPEARAARVVVPDFQLSLAIGKEGQNARLAARLTGWRIDIRSDADAGAGGQAGRAPGDGAGHRAVQDR